MVVLAGNYPTGNIYFAIEHGALTGLYLDTQIGDSCEISDANSLSEDDFKAYKAALKWLNSYFEGEILPIDSVKIELNGSEFCKRVWLELMLIKPGELISYGEIAKRLERKYNRPSSARAVGGAVGSNRLSIILPCHRVIGASGALTGYTGGLDKKIWLLKHEGFEISGNKVSKRR